MNLLLFIFWTVVVWFTSKKYDYFKGWHDGYDEIRKDLSIYDD